MPLAAWGLLPSPSPTPRALLPSWVPLAALAPRMAVPLPGLWEAHSHSHRHSPAPCWRPVGQGPWGHHTPHPSACRVVHRWEGVLVVVVEVVLALLVCPCLPL